MLASVGNPGPSPVVRWDASLPRAPELNTGSEDGKVETAEREGGSVPHQASAKSGVPPRTR